MLLWILVSLVGKSLKVAIRVEKVQYDTIIQYKPDSKLVREIRI